MAGILDDSEWRVRRLIGEADSLRPRTVRAAAVTAFNATIAFTSYAVAIVGSRRSRVDGVSGWSRRTCMRSLLRMHLRKSGGSKRLIIAGRQPNSVARRGRAPGNASVSTRTWPIAWRSPFESCGSPFRRATVPCVSRVRASPNQDRPGAAGGPIRLQHSATAVPARLGFRQNVNAARTIPASYNAPLCRDASESPRRAVSPATRHTLSEDFPWADR
jgi:hypothetical protein